MNLKSITKTAIALIVLLSSVGAVAQEKTKVSLEIDPATFAFKGYGVHLRIQPKNSEHMLFGIGTYAMDFPDVLVGLNSENKDKGWDVRLNSGVGLFGEYHFSEVNSGWFVGSQFAIQEYEIENENFAGTESFNNQLLMGYGGYTFTPFKAPIHIKTWAGMAYTSKISGENTLGVETYDVHPLLMFAAVHLGYTF